MKRLLGVACIPVLLIIIGQAESQAIQGAQDFEVQARLRSEEAERERQLAQLREATDQISTLTKALAEEVSLADGYTTSAQLIETTNKIEDLANEIEDLAKTVRSRAQGR